MKNRARMLGPATVLTLAPGVAKAECLGSCLDDMVAAFASMLVYGLIGIVLLVMLIRAKWRRAGLWGGATIAVLAIGVPLVSQAWLAWKLRAVAAREIVGEPPVIAGRTPLLITPDDYCLGTACEAVLAIRGEVGTYVLLTRSLDGLDLTEPHALVDLPLELWFPPSTSAALPRRELSSAERADVASQIDYLIVTTWPYRAPDPGPLEAGLRANPLLNGMGLSESVRLLLAPITGDLELATLEPDLLDLTLQERALALPLAPRNTRGAGNTNAGDEAAAQSICQMNADGPDVLCRSLLER